MKKIEFTMSQRPVVTNVADLVRDVIEVKNQGGLQKLWFRGHSDADYELLPTIGRPAKYAGVTQTFTPWLEKQLLHRFRRRAFPYDKGVASAGYALFLARHHGFPTRIMDWTANVLFALYFACKSKPEKVGHIWAFRQRKDAQVEDAFELLRCRTEKRLFERDAGRPRVKIVHPVFNSPRLIAQDGGFTWHSHPWTPLEKLQGEKFDEANLDFVEMYKWVIPNHRKLHLLRDLSGLAINDRTAFPDLDGIARSVLDVEVLWNSDPPAPSGGAV